MAHLNLIIDLAKMRREALEFKRVAGNMSSTNETTRTLIYVRSKMDSIIKLLDDRTELTAEDSRARRGSADIITGILGLTSVYTVMETRNIRHELEKDEKELEVITHQHELAIQQNQDQLQTVIDTVNELSTELETQEKDTRMNEKIREMAREIYNRVKIILNIFDHLIHGQVMPGLLPASEITKLVTILKAKIAAKGLTTIRVKPIDVFTLPNTVTIKNRVLGVILHFPVYKRDNVLNLKRFIPTPWLVSNESLATPQPNKKFLLVSNRSPYRFIEVSEAEIMECWIFGFIRICPQIKIFSNTIRESCVASLYDGNQEEIKAACPIVISKMQNLIIELSANRFAIWSVNDTNASFKCDKEENSGLVKLKAGRTTIIVQPGCAVKVLNKEIEVVQDLQIREDYVLRFTSTERIFTKEIRQIIEDHGIEHIPLGDVRKLKVGHFIATSKTHYWEWILVTVILTLATMAVLAFVIAGKQHLRRYKESQVNTLNQTIDEVREAVRRQEERRLIFPIQPVTPYDEETESREREELMRSQTISQESPIIDTPSPNYGARTRSSNSGSGRFQRNFRSFISRRNNEQVRAEQPWTTRPIPIVPPHIWRPTPRLLPGAEREGLMIPSTREEPTSWSDGATGYTRSSPLQEGNFDRFERSEESLTESASGRETMFQGSARIISGPIIGQDIMLGDPEVPTINEWIPKKRGRPRKIRTDDKKDKRKKTESRYKRNKNRKNAFTVMKTNERRLGEETREPVVQEDSDEWDKPEHQNNNIVIIPPTPTPRFVIDQEASRRVAEEHEKHQARSLGRRIISTIPLIPLGSSDDLIHNEESLPPIPPLVFRRVIEPNRGEKEKPQHRQPVIIPIVPRHTEPQEFPTAPVPMEELGAYGDALLPIPVRIQRGLAEVGTMMTLMTESEEDEENNTRAAEMRDASQDTHLD